MFRLIALCALVFACADHSEAQTPFERDKVPAPLREWIPWIEARHPEWSCVGDPADPICRFAGKVSITRSNGVATFSAAVELLAPSSVPLPGSADLPPTNVRIIRSDGTALSTPLASSESMMSVHLPSGSYTVTGELRWEGDRKDFPVPDEYAFVTFTDRTAGTLRRRSGSVWLEEQQTANVDDALSITVMRRITDRSPLLVESLMVLRVSGSSRSAELGVILPAGLRPIDISTTLPHQLTANGALALQLSPGVHEVRISAVGAQPVESLAVPKVAFEGWPGDETWAWVADPSFRSVDVSGAEAVSAAMTSLPPEWQSGAIYRVQAGDSLTLKELQRGELRAAENMLSLNRTLWLDLDGLAFSVADTFSGTMNQGFRLDALNELSVGRATVDGEPAFISRSPTEDANGVELRSQSVNMSAVSRIARESSLSASGWSATFESVSAELRLPPAWRLFHISNAEWVENSWVGSWTLLDLFIALLVVIGTAKLISRLAAVALGLSLLVNHGEFLEPRMLLVHLLIGLTWVALAKDGSDFWKNSGRLFLASTFAVWILQVLTFTKLQLTQFLFPQLQAGTRYRTDLQELYLILEGSFLSWPVVALLLVFGVMGLRWALRAPSVVRSFVRLGILGIGFTFASISVIGFFAMYSAQRSTAYDSSGVPARRINAFVDGRQPAPVSRAYDQNALLEMSSDSVEEFAAAPEKGVDVSNAYQSKRQRRPVLKVVQSGPAEPTWTWKQHRFSFAGPVAPGHRASIYLLSPWMTSILSIIRVGLLFCLAAIFFRRAGYRLPSKMVPEIAIGLLLFLPTQSASAEFPGRELLAELESRMESERCRQSTCASFDELEIRVQENMVRGAAKISATAPTVVTVPGPLDQLPISSIRLNGKETTSIRRSSTGFLQVLVPRGASRLEFDAQLLAQTVVTIQFPQQPVSVKAISDEWSIEGVSSTGSLAGNVRLIPKGEPGKTKTFQETVLPTWFIVTRSLELGETNSVETTVQRMGDTSTPASISVPVLDGERVTTGSVTSEGGVVTARFGIGISTVSYTSSLASFADLKLVSKPSLQLSEVWTVECSPFVVCNVDGLSPTFSVTEGRSRSVWYPFPGDEVRVRLQALTGSPGDTLTVDSVQHVSNWGSTMLGGTIDVQLRATQQSTFNLSLPPQSRLKGTTLDGQSGREVMQDDTLSFLLAPGAHSINVGYELDWQAQFREVVPSITVDVPTNNLTVIVRPSADRWLLWVGGLQWGPAVLFWAKLVFVAAISLFLVRINALPLSRASAVLLSIGLTTLPTYLLLIPLAWLVSLNLLPRCRDRLVWCKPMAISIAFGGLTLVSLTLLYEAVRFGLVIQPPMLIVGNQSNAEVLRWYVDHATSTLPQPWVISLPMWCWRAMMLLWSTWLAVSVVSWLRKALRAFQTIHHGASKIAEATAPDNA